MGRTFIDEFDLHNEALTTIPVYSGCGHNPCECRHCKIPRGYVDRLATIKFLANQKSFDDWLEENMVQV